MSNPIRTLLHHSLPPFNKSIQKLKYANDDYLLKRVAYKIPYKNEAMSEESITLFLLKNPDFVESFLLNNYSYIQLQEIAFKIQVKMADQYGYRRSSEGTMRLSVSKSERHARFGPQLYQPKKEKVMSITSLTSSSISAILRKPFQPSTVKADLTRMRYLSMENSEDRIEAKTLTRFLSIEDVSAWSLNLFRSMKHHNISDECFRPSKLRSMKHLLGQINDDIIIAMRCDGGNLYLVDDKHGLIYRSNEMKPNVANIHKGTTLATYAACERVCVKTNGLFMDDRFPQGVFSVDGSLVEAAMAQPIIMNNGEIVGVIEIFREPGKPQFSEEEEEAFNDYCTWGGIAIFYNEIYNVSFKQRKLYDFLQNVTQKMFEKFHTVDEIIKNIMANAKRLVQADRVSLFLLDKSSKELFSQILDKGNYSECIFEVETKVIKVQVGEGIAGHVAATGETLNISDAYNDERFNRGIDVVTGYITRTILCMPVKLNEEIIGVVQMLNKKDGYFTSVDENDFQSYATYCAVALHIAKMYEKIVRSHQKYKVALEVLSYHSGYTEEEFLQLKSRILPSKIVDIDKLSFWPWIVSCEDQPVYVIFMFKDLFDFELGKSDYGENMAMLEIFDEETIMRFVLTVKKNYRSVSYHNWSHAFSVAHSMYVLLKADSHQFDLYESLALFIGCLCHDLDHRGRNNQYMQQSSSALSGLYTTSTMEHHHFNMTVAILQREGHNIFKHLSSQNYRKVLGHIKHCILATDLVRFFDYKSKIDADPVSFQEDLEANKPVQMALLMTFCDLCSMFKCWEMQLSLVMVIMVEFWAQGDEERARGLTPARMLDRDCKLDLPDCQVGFLRDVCLPCYRLAARVHPGALGAVAAAEDNLARWQQVAALPPDQRAPVIDQLERFSEDFVVSNKLHLK